MTTYSIRSQAAIATTPAVLEGRRAAMVTFSAYPGDPRPRRAIDALLREGMSIDLLCLGHEGAPRRESIGRLSVLRLPIDHRRGGKFSYLFNYSAFLLMCMCLLALYTLRRRYHLVYIHNMPDVLVLSALVPKIFGAKVILDMHDPMPELMTTIFSLDRGNWAVRVLLTLERWSMAFADAVITVNQACKDMFAARSCRAEKVGVVMNSPDGEIFPFRPSSQSPPKTSSQNKRFVVMYHGSLVERNGLDLAVEALERVLKTLPDVELRIYGKQSPFLDQVLNTARDKGIAEAVVYLGPKRLEELVDAIDECDLGVIPNHLSPFTEINTPTRIFEYLSRGKPVVAPRTRGILDYFDSKSLWFFDPGDSVDLARAIEKAALDPDGSAAIAARGQDVYLAHTWDEERKTLLNVVSGLVLKERAA